MTSTVYSAPLPLFASTESGTVQPPGFVPASRREIHSRLQPLITARCPFVNVPEQAPGRWGQGLTAEKMKSCVWVCPKMVVRCLFQEWTVGDHLRRVSYVGVRGDMEAREVVKET